LLTQKTLNTLARYSRTMGILVTLNEAYVDMISSLELRYRIKHELPHYPTLYALENKAVAMEVEALSKCLFR
jgi:hypothetical protein